MKETNSSPSFAVTVRELSLEEFGSIHGVTVDADGNLSFGHGAEPSLACVDPETGRQVRSYPHIRASAGTAFDGSHIWQIAGDEILCVEPATGWVVRSLRTPQGVHCSGMAYVPRALWHGALEENAPCEPAGGECGEVSLRRVEEESGSVLQEVALEGRWDVSGTGVDAQGRLWCGGGSKGGIRAVRLPQG